jgi:hypothetical protein
MYIKHKIVIDYRASLYPRDLMARKVVGSSNHSFDMQNREFLTVPRLSFDHHCCIILLYQE